MFTAALLNNNHAGDNTRISVHEWVKKTWWNATQLFLFLKAKKEKEILPFVTTQMNMEGIMLYELSQKKTNTYGTTYNVEYKKQTNS